MEGKKRDHGRVEIFHILHLRLLAALGIGLLLPGERFRRTLGGEIGANFFNRGGGGVNAFGKRLAPAPLGDDPVIAGQLNPPRKSSVARREEDPVGRSSEDFSVGGTNGIWSGTRGIESQRSFLSVINSARPLPTVSDSSRCVPEMAHKRPGESIFHRVWDR